MSKTYSNIPPKETAVVAALFTDDDSMSSLEELCALCNTAGAEVVGSVTQKREPSSATLFGKGKIEEIKQEIAVKNATLLVVDNELTGTQMRNLCEAFDVKVLDREGLILDIFAMRATSPEGKLQVELAQLKYNLPRLVGISGRLSKFNAGIGMRGPGEKKLETDKRVIRDQITDLTHRINKLKDERDLRRLKRKKSAEKTVSLVGYTNAGKSTILNMLSRSDVLAENKLFATLDPVTRKVFVDENRYFLLTDTVGFIKRLPHEFVNAFSSTLEEAKVADLLLIILDISADDVISQYNVVTEVLTKLNIDYSKAIIVYNKYDLPKTEALPTVGERVFVSAKTGAGMDALKKRIVNRLFGDNFIEKTKDIAEEQAESINEQVADI